MAEVEESCVETGSDVVGNVELGNTGVRTEVVFCLMSVVTIPIVES